MKQLLENIFHLKTHGTTIKKELIAAIATFLSMIYIVFVNPSILKNTGMPQDALITGTIITIIIGTTLAGIVGKMPLALAPGMGLNVFFTYTLVLNHQMTWNEALGIVFISSFIFFILALLGFQKAIIKNLPLSLKLGISTGLGLFLTLIGLTNMGIIGAHPQTLLQLNSLTTTSSLSLIGLCIMVVLAIRNITGFIVIGIIISTIIAIIAGVIPPPKSIISMPPSMIPILGKLSLPHTINIGILSSIFSLMFVSLFDSVSTIAVVSEKMKFSSPEAKDKALSRILKIDAANSALGAILGSSTTITYMESIVGVLAGAKTGLSSLFIALLFLMSLFFTPIITIVPLYITAPALIIVGIFMFQNLKMLNLSNLKDTIVVFITAVMIPLTYNIGYGLMFGFLTYTIIEIATGKILKIHWIIWVITVLALIQLITI